ncbi:MAG TPA: DUF2281 domain-containing protein [Dehalococcoidia bacterium]|nr:DUF2281 domain-containing protein [Dehalococcoidia bacterium]
MDTIEERITALTPERQREVEDFVEFLLEKEKGLRRRRSKPKFAWAGALSDLRPKYTSVELQHKVSEWRIGDR